MADQHVGEWDPSAPNESPRTSWAQDRPRPHVSSLLGAAAGILLLTSLFLFLSEVSGDHQRILGVAISLVFEVAGVALLLLNRNHRAATAGVVLSAIGIGPLLVYLFVDVKHPSKTFDSVGRFSTTTTLILLVSAGIGWPHTSPAPVAATASTWVPPS